MYKRLGVHTSPYLGRFTCYPLTPKMYSYGILKRTGRYHNDLLGINCFNSLCQVDPNYTQIAYVS
ncbi:uncharacterized protein J3R85_016511 [Psidium guajava]|nr:uncharacterized protein J3R85_016511 [Psidium guajava]